MRHRFDQDYPADGEVLVDVSVAGCRCNVLMLDRVTMSDSPVVNGAENTATGPGPKVVVSSWPLLT